MGDPLRDNDLNSFDSHNVENGSERQRLLGQNLRSNITTMPSSTHVVSLEEIVSAIDSISKGK